MHQGCGIQTVYRQNQCNVTFVELNLFLAYHQESGVETQNSKKWLLSDSCIVEGRTCLQIA